MTTPARAPSATQTLRLLCGFAKTRQPASWSEHLAEHGPLPSGRRRRGGDPRLLELVDKSGLTGRGGAGFPTGRKLRTVAGSGRAAVVVANGMEGEPAAQKDALLLAVAPHLVLDGIELAARAVDANHAYVAVHRGSPASAVLRAAVAVRPEPPMPVTIAELPAHYVASEESALVHWLNGGAAKPTFVPPRPFERGVGGRATLVNNVETLAHLALIARHGSEWFRQVGDVGEPGTMLVTICGAVRHPGVVEVATGTAVGEVLRLAGGASAALQAVLVGGYFGTWMDAELALSLPLTQAGLRAVGGALGAGILIALPDSACGIAETAHVLGYLAGQSANQCGPCVNGLPAIAGALTDLARGSWSPARRGDLDRWLGLVPGRGACRHPDGAVRLAVSALQVFAADVHRHEASRPCAGALVPPALPVGAPVSGSWR